MPAVTPNTRKAKGGRKAGAQNFSVSDKEFLVTLLEEIRPLGQEQWDEVVSRYNSEWAEPSERNTRDRDALRGQWYKMLRERKPTGDPSCPDHVRRAKRLNREMTNEIAMGGIDDDHLTASEHEAEAEEESNEAAGDADNGEQDKSTNDLDNNDDKRDAGNAEQSVDIAAEKVVHEQEAAEKEAIQSDAEKANNAQAAASKKPQTEVKSAKKDGKFML
jgi:hypothetical protein